MRRAIVIAIGLCLAFPVSATQGPEIRVLSSRPDEVSGGTALVRLERPGHSQWRVLLDGRDVTASFRPAEGTGQLLALLQGLKPGRNALEVRVKGTSDTKLEILNHSPAGPIFSGPHQQPFICQTEAVGLGPALDADCGAKTLVQYYYKSSEIPKTPAANASSSVIPAGFKLYDPSGPRPADLAQVTLADGRSVDYIIRQELGVINRAIYEIVFLHRPGEPLPTPWKRPVGGWNGRLVYTVAGGCRAGYRQGRLLSNIASKMLTQGYALATSTLNFLDNNCNETISTETAAMVKEHFIKQYGAPDHTIGTGGSSGAVSVYLTAQNHPGIYDGIIPSYSAPDHASVVPVFGDCELLDHAFKESKLPWTEAQKTAVSGFIHWQVCTHIVSFLPTPQLGWFDPTQCDASIPHAMVYDRISNPKGVRCTYYDNEVNIYGRDPATGFTRRPLDNVGVQYGLVAFNDGKIDAEQFIELNQEIGGRDLDGKFISTRTVADSQALRTAYESGMVLTGKNLGDLPIIDWSPYTDDRDDVHTRDRAFITRARLTAAHGDAANQVIFETPYVAEGVDELSVLVPQMDRWLDKIQEDRSAAPQRIKVVRNRPADVADGCTTPEGERVIEPSVYGGVGRCNQLYPIHGNPRIAAGVPLAGDILKCALKPVHPADYAHALTPDQLQRLKSVFPSGVCDFSKPGVGQ